MSATVYWFRNDLRLDDQPALSELDDATGPLLPVYCHADPNEQTRWGFARVGVHRRRFLRSALDGLDAELQLRGVRLLEVEAPTVPGLIELCQRIGAERIVCEDIAAPEEQAEVDALRAAGLEVQSHWQSTLFAESQLPFAVDKLPDQYTRFRVALERADVLPTEPLPPVEHLPPPTSGEVNTDQGQPVEAADGDQRSAFPYFRAEFAGSTQAGMAHLRRYFDSSLLAPTYKSTRNGLIGTDYSTKLSPWLANGALSARRVYAALVEHERAHGRSDGSYWIWFELLWREHFRWLHRKHGRSLYRARGLRRQAATPEHDPRAFQRWCEGRTGHAFVDAGMRELSATGYLSNRMRQVVASYLIHDLNCDYRAGAAWFESQLIDYDVYSNQGNWLYIAGRGTDPRGGRRFNPDKQAEHYDADGRYRELWSR